MSVQKPKIVKIQTPFQLFAHLPRPNIPLSAAKRVSQNVPLYVNVPTYTDEQIERAIQQEVGA